jgi:hypothetical protein
MIEINLFDSNFVGQACSVALQTPKLMRYVRNQVQWPGVTVFTDRWMYSPVVDDVQSRYKIGWLHEGKALHPENYERIWDVVQKFDVIMTHDAELLYKGAHYRGRNEQWPFVKTIRGGSWVPLDQWGMYPKTKNVAMILSEKTQLEGHKLRHAIAQAGLPIDLYGPQHTPIGYDKALAYKDYRFAVVVEACREDNFFSEHLIDALALGCVPIYWGCPNIHEYFPGGFVSFETIRDLLDVLTWPFGQTYLDVAQTLYRDQQIARGYAITEDWQIEHCLRPYVEAR